MTPAPRRYHTEPGELDDLVIPAVFGPLSAGSATAPSHAHGPPETPTPVPTGTELRVCADIARRQAFGLRKYGTSVEANPLALRQWLWHAYEETMDLAIYLRRSIEEIDRAAAAHGTDATRRA